MAAAHTKGYLTLVIVPFEIVWTSDVLQKITPIRPQGKICVSLLILIIII